MGLGKLWNDRLADLFGAGVLGIAGGTCGWILAPGAGWLALGVGAVGGLVGLAAGWLAMRAVPGGGGLLTLAAFELGAVEPIEEEPLLLDDELPVRDADSRVVRLFAVDEMTAGELAARIDRHLGQDAAWEAAAASHAADATDALHAALDDLRRSLRRR